MKPNEGETPCGECCRCHCTMVFTCPVCGKKVKVYDLRHNIVALQSHRDNHIKSCCKKENDDGDTV